MSNIIISLCMLRCLNNYARWCQDALVWVCSVLGNIPVTDLNCHLFTRQVTYSRSVSIYYDIMLLYHSHYLCFVDYQIVVNISFHRRHIAVKKGENKHIYVTQVICGQLSRPTFYVCNNYLYFILNHTSLSDVSTWIKDNEPCSARIRIYSMLWLIL